MSTELTVPGGDPQLPRVPAVVPSAIRAKARSTLEKDLHILDRVIRKRDTKDAVRVQAVKLKASIAGVLSSATVPRDVVEEKIADTATYLRRKFGEDIYATIADDLSAIWDV